MYYTFYRLQADPFRLSPDHSFCYRHPSYAKGRAYMEYALDAAEGFVMVTGKPGMGKTTLINDLLANSSLSKYLVASIVTTRLEADDLLRSIAYEFCLNVQNEDKATVIQKLKRLFILSTRNARPPLLIVDEAQNLSLNALEELRLLTNMQYEGLPLLQIFLLGQEELREKLLDPKLEQLRQRVSAATQLEPLTEKYTEQYIVHRLRVVGWNNHPRISRGVVPILHQTCQGVPRRINQFCSRLFLLGAGEERERLTAEDARQVAIELGEEGLTPKSADAPVAAAEDPPNGSADLGEELFAELAAAEAEKQRKAHKRQVEAESVFDDDALILPDPLPKPTAVATATTDDERSSVDGESGLELHAPPTSEFDDQTTQTSTWEPSLEPLPPSEAVLKKRAADHEPNEWRPARRRPPRRRPLPRKERDEGPETEPAPRRRSAGSTLAVLVVLAVGGGLLYLDGWQELRSWWSEHSDEFAAFIDSTPPADVAGPDAVGSIEDDDVAYPIERGGSTRMNRTEPAMRDDQSPVVRPPDGYFPPEDPVAAGSARRDPPAVSPASGRVSVTRGDSPMNTAGERVRRLATSSEDVRSVGDSTAPGSESPPANPFQRVEEVEFAFDSASVNDRAAKLLAGVARDLNGSSTTVALLLGHTDDTGPAAYNRELSAQRAKAVAGRLSELGVSTSRIVVNAEKSGAYDSLLARVPTPGSKRSVQIVIANR